MAAKTAERDHGDLLIRLTSDHDAIPWNERRDLARSIRAVLRNNLGHEVALQLVRLLADDSKWEVRKEVAELLPLLPDVDQAALAAKLTEDSNGFVRKAAERNLGRSRKVSRDAGLRQRGLDRVLIEFEALRTTHGSTVVNRARALAMRLYELLVAQTVHDLRGVLTPLQANVSALRVRARAGSVDAPAIGDGLGKIADRLSYLERFVNDMSTYSQALPCEKSPAVLSEVITDAHNLVLDAIRAAGHQPTIVDVCISVDAKVTVAMARYQIVTAISNVLKNAYDAVLLAPVKGRRGRVVVSVKVIDDEQMCVEVHDNGVGIPADDLRDVLAFVPGRTTKKGYGTGFGLPIAHRYVAAHGGSISIASKENDGTTVTITLPSNVQQEADE